jgi:hypothetical protein
MITRYRKKPVVVEAVQWDGTNYPEVANFIEWNDLKSVGFSNLGTNEITIHTLEGDMTASRGDYIVKGVDGEFYPCKPDIFKKTYDPVLDERLAEAAATGRIYVKGTDSYAETDVRVGRDCVTTPFFSAPLSEYGKTWALTKEEFAKGGKRNG